MAKKMLAGQLNMFDFYRNYNENASGEVEMVSLVPEFTEPQVQRITIEDAKVFVPEVEEEEILEPEVVEPETIESEPQKQKVVIKNEKNIHKKKEPAPSKKMDNKEDVAMWRQYIIDGQAIEIAYINYNKVRITRENHAPEYFEFATSKAAVDYYVQKKRELEE